jgi:hypothetical protein
MRPRLPSLATMAGLLIAGGCSHPSSVPSKAGSASPETVQWSSNGWSDAERAQYHHLAEGSELMPYVVLANVVSVKTHRPFLDNMERFGFVPDAPSATNPHGLPIGITTVKSRAKNFTGLEMVGFNCAACHVAEVDYRGRRLLIDGAPSLVNLQAYQMEFKESLDATMHDPVKVFTLVLAIDRDLISDNAHADEVSNYKTDPTFKTAGDIASVSTADKGLRSVPSAVADGSRASSALKGKNFATRVPLLLALLRARLAYIKHGDLLLNGTEPGPGRVDAFGAARNMLFYRDAVPMQSPVSFPYIWDVPDNTKQRSATDVVWIHYDGNTNSILERNIGQAVGMGAVYNPDTYESTLRIANLSRLEVLTHKLQSPKWPADLFGPIDELKAKVGEKIFSDVCHDCHQNRLYGLTDVGTDPERAISFGRPVGGGVTFPAAIKPILDGLKARAFADDGIPPAIQAGMDAKPVIWRATGQYLARPLAGVWATGPYLHNGSVPTLWDLLHPAQRPTKFIVGNREYDPVKVGYSTGGNGWSFDTSQPGNSNLGHSGERYGTNLNEDEKAALLEYLKTI